MITQKLGAKMLLIACLGLISACGLVFMPKAKAMTILGNPDPMSKACAVGYTRSLGNFCRLTVVEAAQSLTITGVCTGLDFTATPNPIPSSATAVQVKLAPNIIGASVANTIRRLDLRLYTDSACTLGLQLSSYLVLEQVATASSLLNYAVILPVVSSVNGVVYYTVTRNPCVGCTASITMIGYYD